MSPAQRHKAGQPRSLGAALVHGPPRHFPHRARGSRRDSHGAPGRARCMLMSGQGYANEGNVPANESGGHVYVMRRSRAGTGGKGCTGVRVRAGLPACLWGVCAAPGHCPLGSGTGDGHCLLGSGNRGLSPRQRHWGIVPSAARPGPADPPAGGSHSGFHLSVFSCAGF